MLGVVNLDKPVGPTSHDMVGLIRRLAGMRRVGHAGTLDPLASGVLPILIGQATRFSEELTGGGKRYEARIRLGWRSATDDAQGPLVRGAAPPPLADAVAALSTFAGAQEQRPPAYSARKRDGVPAYRAARSGMPLDLPPRTVHIERLEVLGAEVGEAWLDLSVDVRCGPGTYVRSLARDLGERLGCGGYLLALRRTEAAGLTVAEAVTPATLEQLARDGELAAAVRPVGELLTLPRIQLDAVAATQFVHGQAQRLAAPVASERRTAVYDGERLIGVGLQRGDILQPMKVLAAETRA